MGISPSEELNWKKRLMCVIISSYRVALKSLVDDIVYYVRTMMQAFIYHNQFLNNSLDGYISKYYSMSATTIFINSFELKRNFGHVF